MREIAISFLLSIIIVKAYGEISITDIKIMPENLSIGSILSLEASIVNNSNNTISYKTVCESPLSAEFSNNIVREYEIGCLGFAMSDLEPFDNVTVDGPAAGILYKVRDYGLTKMNLRFEYYIESDIKSINKTLQFMITPAVTNVNYTEFYIESMESVSFKGLVFTLLEVRDYRCPIDLICIWGGDAELLLAIKRDNGIDNAILTLSKPLIIDNHIIKVISLELERISNGEKIYKAKLSVERYEGNIRFKGYNLEKGIIGTLDLNNREGLVILFEGDKREIERFTIEESICNRLSMICIDINNRDVEIGNDFILIDGDYIPTRRVIVS